MPNASINDNNGTAAMELVEPMGSLLQDDSDDAVALVDDVTKRRISNGAKFFLGKNAELDTAALPNPKRAFILTWVFLLMYTLCMGTCVFLFRVEQLVMKDRALKSGTFQAFLLMGMIAGWMMFILSNYKHVHVKNLRRVHIFAFIAGVTNNLGQNGYVFLTTSGGETSVLAPLSSLYIAVPIILGFVILRDKIILRKWFGEFISCSYYLSLLC
jgi:uncharacterized membrane protein